MKENRFENVSKMVAERVSTLASHIAVDNKNQQPFGVPKVEAVDKLYVWDKLTDSHKLALIQRHGMEAFKALEADVRKAKQARGMM